MTKRFLLTSIITASFLLPTSDAITKNTVQAGGYATPDDLAKPQSDVGGLAQQIGAHTQSGRTAPTAVRTRLPVLSDAMTLPKGSVITLPNDLVIQIPAKPTNASIILNATPN